MTVSPSKMLGTVLAMAVLLLLAAACGNGEQDSPHPASPTLGPTSTPPTFTATPSPTATATGEPLATPPDPFYTPEPGTANLLGNSGFEEDRKFWFSLRPPDYQLSTDVVHSGQASAWLRMRVPAEEEGEARVYYLVQEVTPQEFPDLISGYYQVESWKRGTTKQYLQLVVIVFDATNLQGEYPNHQIRYPLTGIYEDPSATANVHFVFIEKGEPTTDQWVYFEANVKEDFERLWGAAPQGYSRIRVLFEVLYEEKEAGLPAKADVYYDDLYMGPASENPNQQ